MKQKARSKIRRKVRKGKEESSATNGAHLQNTHNQQETGESHRSRPSQIDLGIFGDSAGYPQPAVDAWSARTSGASQRRCGTLNRGTSKGLLGTLHPRLASRSGCTSTSAVSQAGCTTFYKNRIEGEIAKARSLPPLWLNACKRRGPASPLPGRQSPLFYMLRHGAGFPEP
jgi:hypothetical protein